MPFDGADDFFGREPPRRPPASETALLVLSFLLVLALLFWPVSIGGFVDAVRYLRGR